MKKTIVCCYFFAFLFLNACSSETTAEQGKIYNHLTLAKDTTLSYALYIPKNKYAEKQLAFIFFDPHGSGELPVSMYKDLADEFGIILIGNNNSSNNTEFMEIHHNFLMLLEEIKTKYKLDEKNICLWGFSGGAKGAIYNAGAQNNIGYSIYGGSVMEIKNMNCDYLGFNGKQDMNYTDLLAFSMQNRNNPRHFQLQFNGKHAWADTTTAKEGFRWFLLKKMQHKELGENKEIISASSSTYKKEIEKDIDEKQYTDALLACNKAIYFLSGLSDVSNFETRRDFILQQPQYKTQLQELQQTVQTESELKNKYQADFFSKDSAYWKKTIDGLRSNAKTDQSGMYDRLLGFISLMSYSFANRAFKENHFNEIQQILFIYRYADPSNPEHAFMRAKMYVLRNQFELARAALQEALKLGVDRSRIANDELLKNL
ncbi:MAG: hypothetical protein JWN78_438 [Bacteroidota bacterium]|nr:hypothetical protein [Bacteroidota bacterium]